MMLKDKRKVLLQKEANLRAAKVIKACDDLPLAVKQRVYTALGVKSETVPGECCHERKAALELAEQEKQTTIRVLRERYRNAPENSMLKTRIHSELTKLGARPRDEAPKDESSTERITSPDLHDDTA